MGLNRAISLFSGAGGLDVGFEDAGFHVVYANEFDHDAACTWRENRKENKEAMHEGDINIILILFSITSNIGHKYNTFD